MHETSSINYVIPDEHPDGGTGLLETNDGMRLDLESPEVIVAPRKYEGGRREHGDATIRPGSKRHRPPPGIAVNRISV